MPVGKLTKFVKAMQEAADEPAKSRHLSVNY